MVFKRKKLNDWHCGKFKIFLAINDGVSIKPRAYTRGFMLSPSSTAGNNAIRRRQSDRKASAATAA